jgi:hypothetical protein
VTLLPHLEVVGSYHKEKVILSTEAYQQLVSIFRVEIHLHAKMAVSVETTLK